MNVSFKVKIFDSKGTHVLPVAKSTLTIGSAPHCDVVLPHPTVSPEHTRAWLEGGCIWVQDLGTSPGTSLNDIRLPALKPMLVRDLDVLRLGQADATLGLEAIAVRAPVVKAKANVTVDAADPLRSEVKAAVKPVELEKRREELEALGRELAEVRLQLQMAKLDKQSAEEMTQQLLNLRNEIKSVQGQKEKWDESLRQIEQEKQVMRKNVESELADFKTKARNDLKDQRDKDAQKIEAWKRDCVADLEKMSHVIGAQKAKRWATRVVGNDLIFEWEADLNHLFKRVLLGDKSAAPVHGEIVSTAPDPEVTGITKTGFTVNRSALVQSEMLSSSEARPASESRKKRRARLAGSMWRSVTVASVAVALLMVGIWWGTDYYFKRRGSRSLSSQTPQTAPRPEAALVPRYEPKQTNKYRASYTDNVLYLQNYVAAEENLEFRRRWATELNKVASSEWKLNQFAAAPVLAKEDVLIRDLSHLKDGINPQAEQEGIIRMRSREAQFLKDLEAGFKNRALVDRFLKFKRTFYLRNQAYLTTTTR